MTKISRSSARFWLAFVLLDFLPSSRMNFFEEQKRKTHLQIKTTEPSLAKLSLMVGLLRAWLVGNEQLNGRLVCLSR